MQTGVCPRQRQIRVQPGVQGGGKGFHPALVGQAHPGNMAGKITVGHELTQCLLLIPADGVGVHGKITLVAFQQPLWQHHAGNAHAGGKAFGKGGQVHHRPVGAGHAL